MKIFKIKPLHVIFLLYITFLPISSFIVNYNSGFNYITQSHVIYPQAINRTGKIFSNLTVFSKDCYINKDQPSLKNQPTIFIPNYNISYAKLFFENITAINYTRNIETEPTEFIISYSEIEPIYVYQKFAVETDQYINNVSIFIQDIIDEDQYNDENSWEVSIVNCSNDPLGTPNSVDTLGTLKKPHPIDVVAHWEVFNFKNSDIGPIFLNTLNTNWTIEDSVRKYWFAIKIKIPPNDGQTGGGPKFLYLNPDGTDPYDIGEGETFAQSPQFINLTYNTDYVEEYYIVDGTLIGGDLDSFRAFDDNRFFINSTPNVENRQIITLYVKLEVENLTNSEYTWDDLINIRKDHPLDWKTILNSIIYSIEFSLVINVSDINSIATAYTIWYNPNDVGIDFLKLDQINILQQTEFLQSFKAIDPEEKLGVIQHMNTSADGNNSIIFGFYYIGKLDSEVYNVTINQFNVKVGEIKSIKTIQKYDPIIHDLHYTNNITLLNSTSNTPDDERIELLKENDDDFLEVLGDSDSNTAIIDLKFNVLTNLDSLLWDVDDPLNWIFNLPNPRIFQIDFRISSNVSIQDISNLTHAVLEIYNGGDFPYFYGRDWFQFSDNKTFADIEEDTKILKFDSYYTWIIMHLLNESEDNSLRMRLRFIGNGTFKGINVSIDEFTLNFHVQNAFSSDIASKIGFGINNNMLKPSDIFMKNFGISISDDGIGKGIWEGNIDCAIISEEGFFEFDVSSLWHAIRFDVRILCEIFKVQPILQFIEFPASQYMTGARIFSVRVIEPNGNPLDSFEIIFEILNAKNITISGTTDLTNKSGIATAPLNFENTGRRYSIRIRFAEQGLYASQEIYSDYIRIVDEYTIFMDNFLKFLPYIIIGLAAIISFLTVRYYRHAKLRRIWAEEAMILDDLIKTTYIMIIHKDVGVSIYDRQISLEGIDADLISGFLQAISQFRYEIKKGAEELAKGEGFEMDYYDFKIVITDGDFIRVALILDGSPSEKLKENQWLFTEHFEKRYGENLKDFTGDITPFRGADDLVEKYFNITLIYPLQLGKHYELIKLKGLEKVLIGVAEQIQKEKKFFFVSSLLNFAMAGRKESRNEIIYSILELKSKGLLIPAKLE